MIHGKLSFSTWRLEKERHQYRPTRGEGNLKRVSDKIVQQNGRRMQNPVQGACLASWRSGGCCVRRGMEGWGGDKGSKQETRASGPRSRACEHCQGLNFSLRSIDSH